MTGLLLKFSDGDTDLVLLVNIVDLLSVCAEEKCHYAKHLCQTVFSVGEILRYLEHSLLPLHHSCSFLHTGCLQLQILLWNERSHLPA